MVDFKDIILERKNLQNYHDKIYENAMEEINIQVSQFENKEEDFNKLFVKSCAYDLSDEILRYFWDTQDYGITVQQIVNRVLNFSYDNEYDPLGTLIASKSNIYNMKNSEETFDNINNMLEQSRIKLFEKEEIRSKNGKTSKKYIERKMIEKGKDKYRNQRAERGEFGDELGNSKGELQVDHELPLATAQLYTRYLNDEKVTRIREFYNSEDNFSEIGERTNRCKGDAKVVEGNIDKTYRASPEEITEAIVKKLEGSNSRKISTTQKLQDEGILDENGKVYPHIKTKIKERITRAQNKESKLILKEMNKKDVAKDAFSETQKSFPKILMGQLLYYLAPPLIYEIKINIEKNLKTDLILDNLEKSGKRIIEYMFSKKTEIFLSISEKGLKKFLKNIFDILIQCIKATIKKIMKCIRQLVLTSVDVFKVILDKTKSKAEKMDAVLKLVSGLIVTIVCEILFEYIEKQFCIPEMFLMPIQILVTIMASNFILLMLEDLDLFNVKYGYNVEKIREIYKKEQIEYENKWKLTLEVSNENVDKIKKELLKEIKEIRSIISEKDIFNYSFYRELERINKMFDMKIDFNEEWKKYLGLEL